MYILCYNSGCQSPPTANKNGCTFFAIIVDVKVYYSQQEWMYILCYNGGYQSLLQSTRLVYTLCYNGIFQSLLQSTIMVVHPLLMVYVKIYYSQQERSCILWYNGICQSPLQSTRMVVHHLPMVDVKFTNKSIKWLETSMCSKNVFESLCADLF